MNTRYFAAFAGAGLLVLSGCGMFSTTPQEAPAPVMSPPAATTPAAPPPPAATPAPAPSYSQDDTRFLLSQNPNAYTIQTVSANDPKTVANFMSRYAGYHCKQIHTPYGRTQYVVFCGVYPTKSQAQQAARGFGDTWVRPLRDVQMQINSGGR